MNRSGLRYYSLIECTFGDLPDQPDQRVTKMVKMNFARCMSCAVTRYWSTVRYHWLCEWYINPLTYLEVGNLYSTLHSCDFHHKPGKFFKSDLLSYHRRLCGSTRTQLKLNQSELFWLQILLWLKTLSDRLAVNGNLCARNEKTDPKRGRGKSYREPNWLDPFFLESREISFVCTKGKKAFN